MFSPAEQCLSQSQRETRINMTSQQWEDGVLGKVLLFIITQHKGRCPIPLGAPYLWNLSIRLSGGRQPRYHRAENGTRQPTLTHMRRHMQMVSGLNGSVLICWVQCREKEIPTTVYTRHWFRLGSTIQMTRLKWSTYVIYMYFIYALIYLYVPNMLTIPIECMMLYNIISFFQCVVDSTQYRFIFICDLFYLLLFARNLPIYW